MPGRQQAILWKREHPKTPDNSLGGEKIVAIPLILLITKEAINIKALREVGQWL